MALSDCIKCWDTPCTCGWEQRNSSIEYLENRICFLQLIIEFKKSNPNAKHSQWFSDPETEDDKRYMEFIRKEI